MTYGDFYNSGVSEIMKWQINNRYNITIENNQYEYSVLGVRQNTLHVIVEQKQFPNSYIQSYF